MIEFHKFTQRLILIASALFVFVAVVLLGWGGVRGDILGMGDVLDYFLSQRFYYYGLGILAVIIVFSLLLSLFASIPNGQFSFGRAKSPKLPPLERQKLQSKYAEVQELMRIGGPSSYRSALVTMDTMLDHALKFYGYEGTLADKLKAGQSRFGDINAVWRAHKHRNKLVHDIHYAPVKAETEESVEILAQALKELGVL